MPLKRILCLTLCLLLALGASLTALAENATTPADLTPEEMEMWQEWSDEEDAAATDEIAQNRW